MLPILNDPSQIPNGKPLATMEAKHTSCRPESELLVVAVGAIRGEVGVSEMRVESTRLIQQNLVLQKNRQRRKLPRKEMGKEVAAMDVALVATHISVDSLGRWHS
jgi:hypothetical protein